MNINSSVLKTVAGAVALLGYAWSEGAFCIPKHQTRVACEDHEGFCSFFAWNYQIQYTKTYNCCYNDFGQYTHTVVTGTDGPTEPSSNSCCTSLVSVSFSDNGWNLTCSQYAVPPNDGGPD